MQFKMTLSFHLPLGRMSKIKNITWQQMLARMWRNRTLSLLLRLQACTTTLEKSLEILQRIGNSSTSGPSDTIPCNISPTYNKSICFPMFIAALFIIARRWKQYRFPWTEEWIQKNLLHLHNGIICNYKNNDFMKF